MSKTLVFEPFCFSGLLNKGVPPLSLVSFYLSSLVAIPKSANFTVNCNDFDYKDLNFCMSLSSLPFFIVFLFFS